ncbi:MAG: magnesium-chelatase subunit [Frankiales bacterium]|nr:magnesium-chelatase subunit [Frankiales bacterium]
MSAPYPFSAVVGMPELKLALLLNAVSPSIGGVLLRGEKGTAKSTVVRGLAALLPAVAVVEGCRFSCDPADPDPACPDGPHLLGAGVLRPARLVELPVGASEDRVVGSLDLERALREGVKAFEPGLLAAAHRGVLYVDEVNLLHDHLVDLLLDAAAMGTAYVEREGVSVRHASRFLLVGTMNPEEGELRPQLLDRFGLTVEVSASREPRERADVVRRRLAYEADPEGFAGDWADGDALLATRIADARDRLGKVSLPDSALREITSVCAAFDVDGLRADIVMARTAIAHAAWEDRDEVTTEDVRIAALLALPHRRRRMPFEQPGIDEQQLDDALASAAPDDDGRGPDDSGPDDSGPDGGSPPPPSGPSDGGSTSDAPADSGQQARATDRDTSGAPGNRTQTSAPSASFRPISLRVPGTNRHGSAAGRRSAAEGVDGRVIRATEAPGGGIHLLATVRAAAPYQIARGRTDRLLLATGDVRRSVRKGRESNLVLFCVDASGSMAARRRMSAVKGAVLSLLLDAYQRRDKVGLITFRGEGAELVLPPTGSIEVAAARLSALETGGRTPVAAGLWRAAELLRVERVRDPHRRALLVVVTDGRATGGKDARNAANRAAAGLALQGVASVVVDAEDGHVKLQLAKELAGHLGAPVYRLEQLAADSLAGVVRDITAA